MNLPKYHLIAAELRARCAELPEGAQLPSEKDLSLEYGASPMTIRRALELLQEEGFVSRAVGRGTFVRRGTIAKSSSLTSFTEDMRIRGMTPGTRILGVDELTPPADVGRDLSLGSSERVLQIERLRLADGEPICLEIAHVPQRYARGLIEAAGESLHRGLAANGAAPATATRRVRAAITTDRQASLLGTPSIFPVLDVVQVFFDERGRAVQRAESWFRADRYEIYSRVRRSER